MRHPAITRGAFQVAHIACQASNADGDTVTRVVPVLKRTVEVPRQLVLDGLRAGVDPETVALAACRSGLIDPSRDAVAVLSAEDPDRESRWYTQLVLVLN